MLSFISDNVGKKDFTERALALELEYFMFRNGADTKAFNTIAVSGKKSSLPHGVPEDVSTPSAAQASSWPWYVVAVSCHCCRTVS